MISSQEKNSLNRVNFMAVAAFISSLAYSIIYPFLPIYLHSARGFSMETVALVYPAMGAANIIGSPVAGYLIDKLGRRPVLLFGPALRSISFFVLAFLAAVEAPFYTFVILLFCTTFIGMFFKNAGLAYVTDLVPSGLRTAAFSRMRVGENVGWMIGPALGSFLAATPFSLLFSLTGALCLVTAAITWYFCPAIASNNSSKPGDISKVSYISILKNDRIFTATLALIFMLYLTVSQLMSTLSIYTTKTIGINQTDLGLLFSLNAAIVILLQVPLNRLLSNMNLNLRMAVGAVLYMIAFAGFSQCSIWIHFAILIAVLTIGEILAETASVSKVSQMAPPDRIGRYMGCFGVLHGLAWSAGPFIGSLLYAGLNQKPVMLWAILSTGALIGAAGFFILRLKEAKNSPAGNSK